MKNILFYALISFFLFSCSKEEHKELVSVKTIEIYNQTYDGFISGVEIISTGGEEVLEKGLCIGLSNSPNIQNDFKFHFEEGNPNFLENKFYLLIDKLIPNQKYYVRSYAINNNGVSYGEEKIVLSQLNIPTEDILDIDGNSYKTVRIGNQIWMKENLKVKRYNNGDPIGKVDQNNIQDWIDGKEGLYILYDFEEEYESKYGLIYNPIVVQDNRKVCPKGYHVPTYDELYELLNYLGSWMTAGNLLKSNNYWKELNKNNNNLSGFSALPGGLLITSHQNELMFIVKEVESFYWSSSIAEKGVGYQYYLKMTDVTEWSRVSAHSSNIMGANIRCIKD